MRCPRISFTAADETVQAATFFTFAADGRIASSIELWPEPYEPPAGRQHLVERLPV